jgi:hypothetical protein
MNQDDELSIYWLFYCTILFSRYPVRLMTVKNVWWSRTVHARSSNAMHVLRQIQYCPVRTSWPGTGSRYRACNDEKEPLALVEE